MSKTMSQEEWSQLIQQRGYQAAMDYAKNFGVLIDGVRPPTIPPSMGGPLGVPALPNVPVTPAPFSARPLQNTPAPPAQGLNAVPTQPQAPQGGLTAATDAPQPDTLPGISLLMQQHLKDVQTARAKQFAQQEQQINKMYGLPSRSDTLMALSQALLSPAPYRGFGGAMYNVNNAMSGILQQRKEAEQQRATALYKLRQTTDDANTDDTWKALQLRYNTAKEQADADAAARREAAKGSGLKSVIPNPTTGRPLDPITGQEIVPPNSRVYTDLENNPTPENLQAMVEAFPRFERELNLAYRRGIIRHGGM